MVFDHSRRRTFSEIVRDLEGDDIIIVSDEEDVADEEADSKRRKVGVAEFFIQSADESDGEDADDEDTVLGSDDTNVGSISGSIVGCPGMSPFSAADADSDGNDSAGGWDGPAPSATKAASGWDEEKDLRWVEWSDGDLPSAPGIRYYHVLSRV
jgi:hypothetical protein